MDYDFQVACHDHFDGSAHCVQCGGPCVLTGTELAYTTLVRFMFEGAAMKPILGHVNPRAGGIPFAALMQLKSSGVNTDQYYERAYESMRKIKTQLLEREKREGFSAQVGEWHRRDSGF